MQVFYDFVTFEPVKRELRLIVEVGSARQHRLDAAGYRSVPGVYGAGYDENTVSGACYDELYLLLHNDE